MNFDIQTVYYVAMLFFGFAGFVKTVLEFSRCYIITARAVISKRAAYVQ